MLRSRKAPARSPGPPEGPEPGSASSRASLRGLSGLVGCRGHSIRGTFLRWAGLSGQPIAPLRAGPEEIMNALRRSFLKLLATGRRRRRLGPDAGPGRPNPRPARRRRRRRSPGCPARAAPSSGGRWAASPWARPPSRAASRCCGSTRRTPRAAPPLEILTLDESPRPRRAHRDRARAGQRAGADRGEPRQGPRAAPGRRDPDRGQAEPRAARGPAPAAAQRAAEHRGVLRGAGPLERGPQGLRQPSAAWCSRASAPRSSARRSSRASGRASPPRRGDLAGALGRPAATRRSTTSPR